LGGGEVVGAEGLDSLELFKFFSASSGIVFIVVALNPLTSGTKVCEILFQIGEGGEGGYEAAVIVGGDAATSKVLAERGDLNVTGCANIFSREFPKASSSRMEFVSKSEKSTTLEVDAMIRKTLNG
jgi:hypothetical protein